MKNNIATKYRWQTFLLFIVILLCLPVIGCGENSSSPDGDADMEIDFDLDAEFAEAEADMTERERPENPSEAMFPKTLWRNEVETGHTFTWGFFPREYFPYIPRATMGLTIVWDKAEHRILSVDPGQYHDLGNWDFVIYSLTEEKSEILAKITLPDLQGGGWEWQNAASNVYELLLVDGKLLWSFQKGVTFLGNPDYDGEGVLSYDLLTGETKYVYKRLKIATEGDLIATMSEVDSNTIMLRRKSGFHLLNIEQETVTQLPASCQSGQEHYSACDLLSGWYAAYLEGFKAPNLDSNGLAIFRNRLVSLEERQNGGLNMISLANIQSDICRNWREHDDCKSAWLPFASDCCLQSFRIINYQDETYIHSYSDTTFYKVDLDRGGLERKAGIIMYDEGTAISSDGTPAENALMGGGLYWLITDDGDLMWVSPYDFSVRGIAGPLDEWAK